MASREEEKRRRREERLAAEQEAAARTQRNQRLRIGAGVALLVLVIAGVGIALAAGGGGGKSSGPQQSSSDGPKVKIPAQQITALKPAAAAAGCKLEDFPSHYDGPNDRGHVPDTTKVHYLTNPPAFGKHFEVPASDGNYVDQGTPKTGNIVHALEHGRIEVQYRPGLPRPEIRQLEALFEEKSDLMLLFQNATGARGDVNVVAWSHIMRCPRYSPKTLDAIRTFRDQYKSKAPEVIPQPE